MEWFFQAVSPEEQKREKSAAQILRKSQWWKSQIGSGRCYYCKNRFHPHDLTMDHRHPIARGGRSSKTNCVPACKECNSEKGYLTESEWALQKSQRN